MKFTGKGQTAMEYMLVVVIAIVVMIAILVWLQGMSETVIGTAGNQSASVRCATYECAEDQDCYEVCGTAEAFCSERGLCKMP